ncbi:PhoP/PhoQ regulator MgrB [Arsenophonus endosymbiont of Bemisia tabaci]|uniref:PhoP/PhoQ regulator MgrB n=1 Tax=Arsenophonus endosymbiont of Bemisia tabaci TaxID=536059 RepID=UPI0015F6D2A0
MENKKIVIATLIVLLCLFLYLVALDSFCDQDQNGGNFTIGICKITDYLPF